MGIQYFYNFCIKGIDDTDLDSDILTAVRKSYFAAFEKIRDRITCDSEGSSMLYDYCIEKNKPLRWTVKNTSGALVQEVVPADSDRYYLCFYREDKLFKRMLFSKLHTLLKAEYMDDSGVVAQSIEPRKAPGGLCLLHTDRQLSEPVVLSAMPEVNDERIAQRQRAEYADYSAVAATNEGIVWFLSDEQMEHFRTFTQTIEQEIESEQDESFIGDEAPLFEKINAKDFNIKRNLSTALDISKARAFGEAADDPLAENGESVNPTDADAESAVLKDVSDDEEPENAGRKPDKLIIADGAVYSYYGELDGNDNRSGYGRTVTDTGRTAYEGMYHNDKRSGKGVYFYKDGALCYSGDWSQNVRHGVGVGVSAHDGSMHIGRWANNKPEGNGVRLSADGEIKFVCKELSDGGTILMNYLEDDTVVISKYDKDGSKLSEKTVSLTD